MPGAAELGTSSRCIADRTGRSLDRHARLLELAHRQLLDEGDLNRALRTLTEAAATELSVDRVGVWLFAGEGMHIHCVVQYSQQQKLHTGGQLRDLSEHRSYLQALRSEEVIVASDARRHRHTRSMTTEYLKPAGITSMMDVPIGQCAQAGGVLCFEHTGPKRRWREDESLFAMSLGTVVSLLLEQSERRRAEAALHRSEEQLRLALEATEDGLWDWDVPKGELRTSVRWSSMLGYQPTELPSTISEWESVCHPEDLPKVHQRLSAHLFGLATSYDFEHRLRHKAGHWVWVRARAKVVSREPDGWPKRIVGTNVDISEQKRVEAELREKHELLDVIREAQAKFIEEVDAGYVFERLLLGALKLTGSERGFIGRIRRTASDDQPKLLILAIHDVLWDAQTRVSSQKQAQSGVMFPDMGMEMLFRAIVRTGSPFIANATTLDTDKAHGKEAGRSPAGVVQSFLGLPFYRNGELMGMVGLANRPGGYDGRIVEYLQPFLSTCTSLTAALQERLRSRAAMRERRRLVALVENSNDCICLLGTSGRIDYINPAGRALFGLSGTPPEELPMFVELVDPAERALFEADFHVLSQTGSARGERRFRHLKSGATLIVEANYFVNRDDHSQRVAVACVVRDITEQRRLAEQLVHIQKMEAVGRLAGGIAHDFNNILTTIQGCSALLLKQSEDAPAEAALVNEILTASNRAAELTRQLLTFSRKQILTPQVLDLGPLVKGLHGMLTRILGENVVLHILAAEKLRKVRVDQSRMEQVVANLVMNARDAMPDGGTVEIAIRNFVHDGATTGELSSLPAGPYVELSCRDSGCGMTAEVLSHLYEPFFSTKQKGQGGGLGLATVYGIIKQSGGTIFVNSQPGQGATFRIYLPSVAEPSEPEPGLPAKSVPVAGNERILLVEDDKSVRELLRLSLSSFGYQVVTARDGYEALSRYEEAERRIDLLVTDVVMPNMGGQELARRIREQQPQLRVLFMTGYTDDPELHQTATGSKAAVIAKPFMPDVLARAARCLLDHPAS